MTVKFELMRGRVDLKKSATVGLVADVADKMIEEVRLLAERVRKLEDTLSKPRPAMVYSGEWVPGFEYDPGDLVEHAGGLHVAVQPIHDNQPPHRGNGWVTLVQLTGA